MGTKEFFRKNLPYYMKRAGMNQIDLAKAVGKSEASVSLWLSGKAFPRIDTIQKIADALGCATDDLIVERSEPDGSRFMSLISPSHPLDPSILSALVERTRPQTPKEDSQMVVLWRTASIQAKRAAIAVLESMKEADLK